VTARTSRPVADFPAVRTFVRKRIRPALAAVFDLLDIVASSTDQDLLP